MYIRQQIEPAGISLGLGWLGDLAASPDPNEARRLKEEMMNLAKGTQVRGPDWRGVERTYQDWFKLKPAEDWEVYYVAAQAAGQLGCGMVRYLRLMKALGANPSPAQTLTSDKQNMELSWTHVDIRLRRNAKGDLQPAGGLPFAPDLSKAILRAQDELKASGKFGGLLPVRAYTIDGHAVSLGPEFAISRGVSVVNIDQKGDGSFQIQSKPGLYNYLRVSDECPLKSA
jgi:hypothetical protein